MSPTDPKPPRQRGRSLVQEVLGLQLAIALIGGLMAVAGLAWTSGAVVRDNLQHWAAQWAAELNELGIAVAARELHETEPVAIRIEPERLGIDGDGVAEVPPRRQVVSMQLDRHRRGSWDFRLRRR